VSPRVRSAALLTGAALLPAVVYLATLLPGVGYAGDTAKFQFVGRVLGTPHATGYPGYILLNHLFTALIPFGSLAWRANLLSAVCAAAACLVTARAARGLGARPAVAAVAGVSLGLTGLFWSQAVVAEVYALHALLTAAVLALMLRWTRSRRPGDLVLAGLVFALSFGNHMTTVVLLLPLIVWVPVVDAGALKRWWLWPALLACAALGAAQYGYLIWRWHDPTTVFQEVKVPDLAALWAVATGEQFSGWLFALPAGEVWGARFPALLGRLARELGPLLPFVLWGLARLRPRRLLAPLLLFALGTVFFAANYEIPDIDLYLIPAVVALCLPLAVGLEDLTRRLGRHSAWAWAALPAALFALNLAGADRHADVADAARAEAVIDKAAPGAVIAAPDYATASYLRYYLLGEERQQRDRIYLLKVLRAPLAARYVRGEGDLTLVDQRLALPPGLKLFAMDDERIDLLRLQGLNARAVGDGLFLMTPDATTTDHDGELRPALCDGRLRPVAGWRDPEPWGMWITEPRAVLDVAPEHLPATLVVTATTWAGDDQRRACRVLLDGRDVSGFVETGPSWRWRERRVDLPAASVPIGGGRCAITLEFDDAGYDAERRLSLPVRGVRLEYPPARIPGRPGAAR